MTSSNAVSEEMVMLTSDQQRILSLVLNMIVPPSPQRKLPGAADINFLEFLQTRATDIVPEIRRELDQLELLAKKQFACAFVTLQEQQRQSLVDEVRKLEPNFMNRLALETVTCYYEHPGVLAALEIEDRPPYPEGHQVIAGDLMLLQPVRKRGKIYRDA